jgi:hypothetical protein
VPVQDDDTIRVVSRSRSDGSGRGNLFLLSSSPEVDPEDRKPHNSQEARPRKMPSMLTSVIVVRMILEAFAGSVPILRRTMGIADLKMPLIKQLVTQHGDPHGISGAR